jgi:DNA-binding LacI/PurR family transcriptional regulator
LRGSRTNVIALVVPFHEGTDAQVRMDFISAIVGAANKHLLNVLLVTAETGNREIERVVSSAMVDGLVIMEVDAKDDRIALLRELGKPTVLLGMPDEPMGLPYIDLDFATAGSRCVEHLAGIGCNEMAFLGMPSSFYERGSSFSLRLRSGAEAALRARGHTMPFAPLEPDRSQVFETIRALLSTHPEVTGLIVHNQLPFVLDALRELEIKVPEEMSVVTISPLDLARQLAPAVSSVVLPVEELGRRALEYLVEAIAGTTPTSVLLQTEVFSGTRSATAAPRKR